jgi:hypothetical protein
MAGKKGHSGRKSAYQELKDATEAHKLFFDNQNQAAIEEKIASRIFSLKDRFILNGMEGDTTILTNALKKAVPDELDVKSGGKALKGNTIKFVGFDHGTDSQ